MRNIRLLPPKRTIRVDSPLQTAWDMLFYAAVVVGLALAAPVIRVWASYGWGL